MIRTKRIMSLALTCTMCLGLGIQADASELNETREKASQLQNQKKAAEDEKASLAAQLAEARGVRIERDPALPYRALAGACVGALLLLSDEHGVVAAGDAPDAPVDDLVDLLVAGYEKLRG